MRFWYEYEAHKGGKWIAGYPEDRDLPDGGFKQVRVMVDDVTSNECPRSILLRDPQAQDLIQIFNQSQNIPGVLGDPSKWPGHFVDSHSALLTAQSIDLNARHKAK